MTLPTVGDPTRPRAGHRSGCQADRTAASWHVADDGRASSRPEARERIEAPFALVVRLLATQKWPNARLFSFEPAPQPFEALHQNVGHLPNVTLFNLALGDARQTRELTFYPRYTMMSGFDGDPASDKALVRSYIENVAATLDDEVRRAVLVDEAEELLEGRFDDAEKIACTVERMESVAAQLRIAHVDFRKLDVEGFEVKVLEGIGAELWPGIRNAVVEVEDDNGELEAVTELFAANGMRTSVEQPHEYRGTSVFTLFATRTS